MVTSLVQTNNVSDGEFNNTTNSNVKFVKFDIVPYENTLVFGKNQENRQENPAHLAKIKNQLLSSMDVIPPITVNVVTNNVIDGQHRFKAYKELIENGKIDRNTKLKVMYVDIPIDEEKKAIVDANTHSKNWSLDDYVNSYVRAGIISYQKLDDWCRKHPLASENGKPKYRYGSAIITGKRCQNELKSGTFSFSESQLSIADDIHAEMLEIVELFGLKGKGPWIESLAVSWTEVRNQHKFRTWMSEFKKKKGKLLKMPKDNQYEWDSIFSIVHLAIDKKQIM